MYNYHDIFFYYAFGTLNGGGGSIQVIGITEGTTSVTFESNGKPLITYRIYGSSSGVGDLNTETGKYDITVTCNEDTYTISLDAPLMDGEYIDYKTQRLYPSGLDVSMPEISTIEGTNTLTVITTNPSSKVYVECYRAKDIPLPVASTIIGSVPFEFQCYEAGNLMDYSISGNAVQDGTPSADAPVDATGSGVRTENVMPAGELKTVESNGVTFSSDGKGKYTISGTATAAASVRFDLLSAFTTPISVSDGGQGTLSFFNTQSNNNVTFVFYNGATKVDYWKMTPSNRIITTYHAVSNKYVDSVSITVTSGATVDMTITTEFTDDGVPPSEFEPYGFKLPVAVNGTEYPIYLGTVPTTRRVKKLVLTGEENISKIGVNAPYAYIARNVLQGSSKGRTSFICSHIPAVYYYQGENPSMVIGDNLFDLYLNIGKELIELQPSGNTVAGLKEYLAAQYAAGTPVTVWYVLAEPETAVVNEPLMKIGDYADTITFDQAGVNIPVIKGNNVLTINTDVPPSETYIKYNGKEKEYGYYITSDGYIYTTSDGYKYGIRS